MLLQQSRLSLFNSHICCRSLHVQHVVARIRVIANYNMQIIRPKVTWGKNRDLDPPISPRMWLTAPHLPGAGSREIPGFRAKIQSRARDLEKIMQESIQYYYVSPRTVTH